MFFQTEGVTYDSFTTAQRDALVLPKTGTVLYNSDATQLEVNVGTPGVPNWQPVVTVAGLGLESGKLDTFSFGAANNFYVRSNNAAWSRRGSFRYEGTNNVNEINKIMLNCWRQSGVGADFRIYDSTNGNVIATLISVVSNSDVNVEDMGAISNLPTGPAIFELQMRRTGPGSEGRCASIQVQYA